MAPVRGLLNLAAYNSLRRRSRYRSEVQEKESAMGARENEKKRKALEYHLRSAIERLDYGSNRSFPKTIEEAVRAAVNEDFFFLNKIHVKYLLILYDMTYCDVFPQERLRFWQQFFPCEENKSEPLEKSIS